MYISYTNANDDIDSNLDSATKQLSLLLRVSDMLVSCMLTGWQIGELIVGLICCPDRNNAAWKRPSSR